MSEQAGELAGSGWPQERSRNVCILAHVDHGKTTAADNLVAANGIISRTSAGKIRYLDSRIDEQERQITMKSSAIALRWSLPGQLPYQVNLIDSPGHVDFTSEVSAAARLADGALVVVDVVEGVEAQTRTVLRQAWRDRVRTVLLLNKVDRLIVELEMTPMEAYQRLGKIVEQVNVLMQQLLTEDIMAKETGAEDASAQAEATGSIAQQEVDLTHCLEYDVSVEDALRYSPERGNVAFGSAVHGWAFRINDFAQLVAGKMGAKPQALQKVLWGDWSFSPKTKKAQRRSTTDTKTKPMFVQFVLEQLWRAYGSTYKFLDIDQLERMKAQIPSLQDLDLSKLSAGPAAARELLSRWLPFADCILQMTAEHLPSPLEAAPTRLPVLCPRWFAAGADATSGPVADALRRSDSSGPTVVYLAKFLGADLERLSLTGDALVGDEDVHFIGLCRVFSGTVRPGQELGVMAEDTSGNMKRVLKVGRMFRLMGRFLADVKEAPSGSVVALQVSEVGASGTDAAELGVERCLTLCDAADGPFFETPYSSQAYSIVRVSIGAQHVSDLDALARGLRLLHRADPSVSVEALSSGENVLGCCGDEHLKRCVTDLQNQFARGIALSISTPLVAIRESLAASVAPERLDPKGHTLWMPTWASHLVDASTEASSQFSNEHDEGADAIVSAQQERLSMSCAGAVSVWTANRKACVRVSAVALPPEVLNWMDEQVEELETVVHRHRASPAFVSGQVPTLEACLEGIAGLFEQRLQDVGDDSICAGLEGTLCGMSVAKGSRAVLIDATDSGWTLPASGLTSCGVATDTTAHGGGGERVPSWMRASLLSGFQLAAASGPLCEEPVRGVAWVIQGCQVMNLEESGGAPGLQQPAIAAEPYGPMSGQVMVATKEACRHCLFKRGFARICEAMLALEVQCEQEMLGKVYSVLGKRRAKVLEEGLRDGTSLFFINSHLPLADSFGLARDLRQAASGQISFHCAFSHWELSEDDPFQEASLTPDEIEELGDQPLPPNVARKLIDAIRKRKGLATDEKVVLNATKQRTVTRMK